MERSFSSIGLKLDRAPAERSWSLEESPVPGKQTRLLLVLVNVLMNGQSSSAISLYVLRAAGFPEHPRD